MSVATVPPPSSLPELVTTDDVARAAGVVPATVRIWVKQGRLPKPLKLGRRLLWPPDVIRDFINGDRGAA